VVSVGEGLAETRPGIGNRVRRRHADTVETLGGGELAEKRAGGGRV
jgi:hypothetical protein